MRIKRRSGTSRIRGALPSLRRPDVKCAGAVRSARDAAIVLMIAVRRPFPIFRRAWRRDGGRGEGHGFPGQDQTLILSMGRIWHAPQHLR